MPPADTRRVVPTPPHALRRSASSRHCACTFYLVFKEPATWWFASSPLGPAVTTFPISFISFGGTLQSYRAVTFPSTLFSLQRRFFRGAFESAAPHAGKGSTVSGGFARSGCGLEVRAEGSVSTPRYRASPERGHARSNQYTLRFRDCQHRQPPELSAHQNRVTCWLVEL
jgi:hypothetical protein